MFTLIIFFISSFANFLVNGDICGNYAILSEVQSFYISQPYTHTINLGLDNYQKSIDDMKNQASLFFDIAQNYSTIEKIKSIEPDTLIPFGPDKNLIKIQETQHTLLPDACQKQNARLVSFDPLEKQQLLKILKNLNLDSIPFFAYHTPKSLLSRNVKQLDSPGAGSLAGLAKVGITAYPVLSKEGVITYPDPSAADTTFRSIALCEKDNNFWDRSSTSQQNFVNIIAKIQSGALKLKDIGQTFTDTLALIGKLPKPSSSLLANKFLPSTPSALLKITSFFQKYNNKDSWETSKPFAIDDFLTIPRLFKEIKNLFKFKKPKTITDQITFSNDSIVLSNMDEERLLAFVGLDPERFGISGNVGLQPLMSIPDPSSSNEALSTSNSMTAQMTMKIYDRQDVAKIYSVRPLINNNAVTTVTHVVTTPRHSQATLSEPTPYQCFSSNRDQIQICDGYQTSGPADLHQQSLLTCGRALVQLNTSIDYAKCPTTPAPADPLTYRATCDGESTAVLSSTRPLAVRVYCDTFVEETKLFTSFPVFMQTDCEVRESLNDSDSSKTLLPQLPADFFQQQKVNKIITKTPFVVPTVASETLLNNPVILIAGVSVLIVIVLLIFMILILAAFDPQRCLSITHQICCCFVKLGNCCKTCCKSSHCCQPLNDITQIELQYQQPRRNIYTNNTNATAPVNLDNLDMDNENAFFLSSANQNLSRKSSVKSAKSSINDIKPYVPINPPVNRLIQKN